MSLDLSGITVNQLSFKYPKAKTCVLDSIDLTCKLGQCTGLIGPNGAGKSTFLSLLSGLLPLQQGSVSYPQNSQLNQADYLKKHLALVPQEYAFYMHLTVIQNLRFFAGFCQQSKQQQTHNIQSSIEHCQLAEYLDKPASTLSGGYKRRLNLAIALLKQPKYLFLDEPTVGVDPSSRQTIINLIKRLKSQGVTIIYTSHLLTEVEDICERTYVLNQGKLQSIETANQSKTLVVHYSEPATPEQINQLTNCFCNIEINQHLAQLKNCDLPTSIQVLSLMQQINLSVDAVHYESPTLHDLYMSLVQS
ncbi:ABC transporter [Catenovulum agarivorans DS-2]|uniref:ABC transporter n=1 Tax=Catenovulum agarivorans DS-2 TaxID=1328313 RepID=W7QNR6_9ALTE|nr:ABC transporter ATP-binding protein [Catenovulum agarivorans]EWH10592.1 ABC transporter [Catenovulum agarivorans DS-2]